MVHRFYSNPTLGHRMSIVGEFQNETLKIAVAVTRENEVFIRKIGRAIAEGRLEKGKLHSIVNLPGKDKLMSEEFVTIAEKIAEEKILEIKTRKRNGKD
jgi:hypothetical protein